MKKIFAFCLALIILSLSACGEKNSENKNDVKATADKASETIGTKTVNTYKKGKSKTYTSVRANNYKKATSNEESVSFTDPKITVSEKAETTIKVVIDSEYQLKIKYKNLNDLNKKVSAYKSLKKVLKSGKISEERNANAVNSFSEQGLGMIFNSKYFYLPNEPKGYKLKKIYLTSSNFFCFIYKGKNKKQCALRVYTSYDTDQNDSAFTLSFTDNSGKDIYKNKSGQYCWYDINDYIIMFTGKDKAFINNLTLSQVAINYTPKSKMKKKKK